MSDSVRPHRQWPTRLPRPWDSPGKNTGVGCHFLLQCMKGKSESEVSQSCLTLRDPMVCSLPGSSVHGIFQTRVLEWGAIAFSSVGTSTYKFRLFQVLSSHICLVAVSLDGTMPNIFFFFFFFFNLDAILYNTILISGVQFSSVTQTCLNLCGPMNRSTPGLPVHHQLQEFTQTHIHRVSDAIQPSHPLPSPSPSAPNPSQHQSLFQ